MGLAVRSRRGRDRLRAGALLVGTQRRDSCSSCSRAPPLAREHLGPLVGGYPAHFFYHSLFRPVFLRGARAQPRAVSGCGAGAGGRVLDQGKCRRADPACIPGLRASDLHISSGMDLDHGWGPGDAGAQPRIDVVDLR